MFHELNCGMTKFSGPHVSSQAFEQAGRDQQAGRDHGHVFGRSGNMDFEKIRQSKYFQTLFQQTRGRDSNELV